MLKFYSYKILTEIGKKIRSFNFLRKYRKDTPESTWKFYNKMRYIYNAEFIKRENFSKILDNTEFTNALSQNGFAILNLSDITKDKTFTDAIIKFRKKFDEVNQNSIENRDHSSKRFLINYTFDFNKEIKNIADPFVDIVTKYLGTLPILNTFQMWYSPNNDSELIGSKLLHRDGEDFRQIKIFIPIEEVQIENGPLHLINKQESKVLYENLIKKKLITRRNQKINDKYVAELKPKIDKILLKEDQCALVDTCACYHFGSRKSSKPRKLLFLHFTSAFSSSTPIFRNYDTEKKFTLEKDKLVYGLQKKISSHSKKSIYLPI